MEESAGWTNIFIYPGYRFKVLDGLITNFHLPDILVPPRGEGSSAAKGGGGEGDGFFS